MWGHTPVGLTSVLVLLSSAFFLCLISEMAYFVSNGTLHPTHPFAPTWSHLCNLWMALNGFICADVPLRNDSLLTVLVLELLI